MKKKKKARKKTVKKKAVKTMARKKQRKKARKSRVRTITKYIRSKGRAMKKRTKRYSKKLNIVEAVMPIIVGASGAIVVNRGFALLMPSVNDRNKTFLKIGLGLAASLTIKNKYIKYAGAGTAILGMVDLIKSTVPALAADDYTDDEQALLAMYDNSLQQEVGANVDFSGNLIPAEVGANVDFSGYENESF